MTDKPWTCPVCGRGVAPGVETCDHVEEDPVDAVSDIYVVTTDDAGTKPYRTVMKGGKKVWRPVFNPLEHSPL